MATVLEAFPDQETAWKVIGERLWSNGGTNGALYAGTPVDIMAFFLFPLGRLSPAVLMENYIAERK